MHAVINDNKKIRLCHVTADVEEILLTHFSVKHRQHRYLDTGRWDGIYRRYNMKAQTLALPFLNELKLCCEKYKIPLDIFDKRQSPRYPAPPPDAVKSDLFESITLEPHQIGALKAMLDNEMGVISCVTGGGKTETMAGMIKLLRCPTIVITEQLVVLDQIVSRLKMRHAVFDDDVGKFCHGETPDGNLVIVGSIQSLSSPSAPKRPICTREKVLKQLKRNPEKLREIFPDKLADILIEDPEKLDRLDGRFYEDAKAFVEKQQLQKLVKAYNSRKEKSKKLQEMAKKCDMILIDECDHAVSKNYSKLFRFWFNGRRRYGFSGTPTDKKKPVEALFLKENLGNVIYETSRRFLENIQRIIPITYYQIAIGDPINKKNKSALDIAVKDHIITNTEFHKKVAKITDAFKNDRTLILVDTSPIADLGFMLESIIPNSKFIYGKTSQKERWKYIKLFESGELSCLIGGKILKRGLDLKNGCHNLIMCGGGDMWSDFDQKIGRAVRNNDRNKARVFDFLFYDNFYLYKHSRERLKCAVSLGYKTVVVVNGQQIDGEKFIKSKFRIPKSFPKK